MSIADHPVFQALVPVFLLIGTGVFVGRRGWVGPGAIKELSNLVFLLLIPALLFRTMSQVRLDSLDWRPIAAYFSAVLPWFGAQVLWYGFTPRGIVLALGGTFSNLVMIGIALVGLAYGQAGLVTLLTLIAVHALILLTVASVALELADARQRALDQPLDRQRLWRASVAAMRASIIHPIPLPIACGLLWGASGLALPAVVDRPLHLLGQAFGPLALVLVGISLAHTPLRGRWREALGVALAKNVVVPLLVAASAWAWGLRGLPLTVLVVAAAVPVGANVFLFAQRYRVAQAEVTAATAVSTALALLTLSIVMLAMGAPSDTARAMAP
ncbi:AEC family transporter [Tepidimonas charontis]|uniref:2a69: auxin efflux carrier n=1 Tax=Tepidimonas charontis TaxID=2267262 RepID=A0A554XFM4_9BURK|nr:AEC family transporter [Tepidimonas charontis]TSE34625.1 2a69: auxin efflux carrier [Tepidimonas charontis]